jgi:hypothetical protein
MVQILAESGTKPDGCKNFVIKTSFVSGQQDSRIKFSWGGCHQCSVTILMNRTGRGVTRKKIAHCRHKAIIASRGLQRSAILGRALGR